MTAGLLGRTLGHSLSPQIHLLFGDYGYRLYEKEPDEVESFIRGAFASGELDFLNVTIPYKRTALTVCDELTPMAEKLGNVNFVMRTAGGRLRGDNTDAFGVERLLEANGIDVSGWNCAILGAGGAAMTAKAVLEEHGARRVSFIRRGESPSPDDDLILNATPVGMWPHADEVRVDVVRYPSCRAVVDLVYNPSPTRLVREARACGKTAADGMVMLIAQAYRAFLLSQSVNRTIEQSGNLFLYGPPASGKSTLARQIAAATGFRRVDLDEEIVAAEGRSIPEIFATQGEAGFRAAERRALMRVSAAKGQVVALGGGALLDDACRRIAEAAGRVVVLDCDLETLESRLTGADRPLSADPEKLRRLVASRAGHYSSFHRVVKMV